MLKVSRKISDDVGGTAEFFLEGGTFFLAMSGIGVGLAVFGAGSAIAGLSDSLNKYVGNEAWASSIKKNVLTLLSIKDEAGGNLDFLADSGTFVIAMTAIGTGLAVFGAGSAIGGMSDALTSFMKPDWASSIKNKITRKILEIIAGIDIRVQLPKYNSETFSNFFKELTSPSLLLPNLKLSLTKIYLGLIFLYKTFFIKFVYLVFENFLSNFLLIIKSILYDFKISIF